MTTTNPVPSPSTSPSSSRAAAAAAPVQARHAVVVMGVAGTGKSTVASGIAAALGLACIDGDDLHAPASVAKMSAGIALDDADRWPWLDLIGARLAGAAAPGLVVSCSALKRIYRDRLRAAAPGVRFIFLDGDEALIRARMERRAGHYMPVALLRTQLQTLERPGADEPDVTAQSIVGPSDEVITSAVAALRRQPSATG